MLKKYYHPIREILQYNIARCEDLKAVKILEIGPGIKPFSEATHFVDWLPYRENTTMIDLNKFSALPFTDKEFDFVYCRHVLEDLSNPYYLFTEIMRVGKAGFLETPSPLAETTMNVDINTNHVGYIHHKSIIWSETNGIFSVLDKYPIIEKLPPVFYRPELEDPWCWNSYFEWDEKSTLEYKHYRHDKDYNLHTPSYHNFVIEAVEQGIKSSQRFRKKLTGK